MGKRRVALLCPQQLLGESLEHTLRNVSDITLLGPWALEEDALQHLIESRAEIVVIVEADDTPHGAATLTAQLLEQNPTLPIIRVTLEQNVVRYYSSQTLPAKSSDLIDLIHNLPEVDKNADA